MGEYNDMRKELERSEKQRMQLSDHIQVGRLKITVWTIYKKVFMYKNVVM